MNIFKWIWDKIRFKVNLGSARDIYRTPKPLTESQIDDWDRAIEQARKCKTPEELNAIFGPQRNGRNGLK